MAMSSLDITVTIDQIINAMADHAGHRSEETSPRMDMDVFDVRCSCGVEIAISGQVVSNTHRNDPAAGTFKVSREALYGAPKPPCVATAEDSLFVEAQRESREPYLGAVSKADASDRWSREVKTRLAERQRLYAPSVGWDPEGD